MLSARLPSQEGPEEAPGSLAGVRFAHRCVTGAESKAALEPESPSSPAPCSTREGRAKVAASLPSHSLG